MMDLTELLHYPCESTPVYSDSHSCRVKTLFRVSPDIEAEIIEDCFLTWGAALVQVSISASRNTKACMRLPQYCLQPLAEGVGQCLVPVSGKGRIFWFPIPGLYRVYTPTDHLERQETINNQWISPPSGATIEYTLREDSRTEIVFLRFDAGSGFLHEMGSFSPIEQRPVRTDYFFQYRSISDPFLHIARGQIYHLPFLFRVPSVGCPMQQAANSFYQYTDYLHQQTGKKLYALMRDWAALSVMLSVPENGQWRHGHWTEEIETHLRHQADGIDLLLDLYEKTRQPVLLAKACQAMEYVLSCTDTLSGGGLWFLHDSLEVSESLRKLHYKDYNPVEAFGKSRSNTLCLNTHLWTLLVLKRLASLIQNSDYDSFIARGMQALKQVLSARPATVYYAAVYGIRDAVRQIELRFRHPWISRWARSYDGRLRDQVAIAMKARWPRLFMPNGYIERDLDATCLSDYYHLQTLKDLAMLAAETGDPQLHKQVIRSLKYTLYSRFYQWYLRSRDWRINVLAEILFLVATAVDPKWLPSLSRFMRFCWQKQVPLAVDLLAHPYIADRRQLLQADNPDVLVLRPKFQRFFQALILNPTSLHQAFQLRWAPGISPDEYLLLDARRHILDSNKPLRLGPADYLLVCRK